MSCQSGHLRAYSEKGEKADKNMKENVGGKW